MTAVASVERTFFRLQSIAPCMPQGAAESEDTCDSVPPKPHWDTIIGGKSKNFFSLHDKAHEHWSGQTLSWSHLPRTLGHFFFCAEEIVGPLVAEFFRQTHECTRPPTAWDRSLQFGNLLREWWWRGPTIWMTDRKLPSSSLSVFRQFVGVADVKDAFGRSCIRADLTPWFGVGQGTATKLNAIDTEVGGSRSQADQVVNLPWSSVPMAQRSWNGRALHANALTMTLMMWL